MPAGCRCDLELAEGGRYPGLYILTAHANPAVRALVRRIAKQLPCCNVPEFYSGFPSRWLTNNHLLCVSVLIPSSASSLL